MEQEPSESVYENMGNYNKQLNKLFDEWSNLPNEKEFCKDGLMLKYFEEYKPDFVDEQWEKAPVRVAFLVKEANDGYGYDARLLLNGHKEAEQIRNLKGGRISRVGFYPNIANIFFGILSAAKGDRKGYDYIKERPDQVKAVFNKEPFALIECKKTAGSTVSNDNNLRKYIDSNEEFLIKELKILAPNVIVCCDPHDIIFDFVTKKLFEGKNSEAQFGSKEYMVKNRIHCAQYYNSDNTPYSAANGVAVVKSFHPVTRGKAKWEIYEYSISPFGALAHWFLNERNKK